MNNILQIIGKTAVAILIVGEFYAAILITSAMEDQTRCDNGATEYCQGGQDDEILE